jgi:hypothetical protein
VTSAAAAMVAVGSPPSPSTQQDLKQLTVALASAILIDPTLVLAVLASDHQGAAREGSNWHLPKPRHFPPKLEHEPEVAPGRA